MKVRNLRRRLTSLLTALALISGLGIILASSASASQFVRSVEALVT